MRKSAALLASLVLLTGLSACTSSDSTDRSANPGESAAASFPLDIQSCGETLHFEQAPERVVLLNEINAPILYQLDVLDHVVAKAGEKRVSDEDAGLRSALDQIAVMEGTVSEGGGIMVNNESILDVQADLVITYSPKSRESLTELGIPVYVPAGMCPDLAETQASWSWVDNEIDAMAAIFAAQDRAAEVKASVAEQLAAITELGDGQSAAAVYVTPGVTTLWTYGSASMTQPIFETNGLTNIYGDQEKRVFEVAPEDLLAKNPDWIIVLTLASTDEEALAAFQSFPGIDGLDAVNSGRIVHIPYALVDPASTLSVQGAQQLNDALAEKH